MTNWYIIVDQNGQSHGMHAEDSEEEAVTQAWRACYGNPTDFPEITLFAKKMTPEEVGRRIRG